MARDARSRHGSSGRIDTSEQRAIESAGQPRTRETLAADLRRLGLSAGQNSSLADQFIGLGLGILNHVLGTGLGIGHHGFSLFFSTLMGLGSIGISIGLGGLGVAVGLVDHAGGLSLSRGHGFLCRVRRLVQDVLLLLDNLGRFFQRGVIAG